LSKKTDEQDRRILDFSKEFAIDQIFAHRTGYLHNDIVTLLENGESMPDDLVVWFPYSHVRGFDLLDLIDKQVLIYKKFATDVIG
jgi:hypothetical protein